MVVVSAAALAQSNAAITSLGPNFSSFSSGTASSRFSYPRKRRFSLPRHIQF